MSCIRDSKSGRDKLLSLVLRLSDIYVYHFTKIIKKTAELHPFDRV